MDKSNTHNQDNLAAALVFKFLPFWPLFVVLLVLSLGGAWAYLKYFAIPTYGVSASIIVLDEEKGVDASKMLQSIDAFTSNKIVDNEINVLRSHALMKEVVKDLRLYAPIYEEEEFRSLPAYATSPITVSLLAPEEATEHYMIYFTYDQAGKKVNINGESYPLDKWVKTPYGVLSFSENIKQTGVANGPLYFSILNSSGVADQLIASILIESAGKLSSMINLYIEDKVPQRGEDILNSLIQEYRQAAIDERNQLAAQTLEFVENRIQLIEKELSELETQIVQYRSSKGAINLNEQGRLFLENVGSNDRRIAEINLQLAVLDKVENYVIAKDKASGIVPSTLGIEDPILSQLLKKLYDAEIKYDELSKTTAANHPLLVSLRQEIASIRPGILENIQNQRDNLVTSRANVVSTNNKYNTVLQSIPSQERELLELTRQQSIKNDAYSFLLQKREETVLSYAPTTEDMKVVDLAKSTRYPTGPNSRYIYLSAVILAFGAGIGLVIGKEMLNTKVLFRSEIENYIDAPIVAELASVKKKKKGKFEGPSEVSEIEQFRQLRVTMGLYGRTFTRRKILVTSSIPGEGKSYVSSNLALSLASSGKRVVLVDFDLRNPNTSLMFELTQQEGIIEYLSSDINPEEIVRSTEFENLSVVPAGLNIGDHTELLLNSRMELLFKYLEESFDYVILDTAPIDLVSDAYLLSEYCDITLLVIRHDVTPKSLVLRLSQNNKLSTLNGLAIVFNGVKPRGFVKGQYGYGYGYGYESRYADKTYRARKAAIKP